MIVADKLKSRYMLNRKVFIGKKFNEKCVKKIHEPLCRHTSIAVHESFSVLCEDFYIVIS